MRLAHSYSEPIYVVTMRAHILLVVAVRRPVDVRLK